MRLASRLRWQQRMINLGTFSPFCRTYSFVDFPCPEDTPLYWSLIVSLTYVDENLTWVSLGILTCGLT